MTSTRAEPAVSVVTIFRNAAPFLEEAVASVLGQSYGDWELLLVDDGSDDGSEAIAQDYAARYPDRIRYLSHPSRQHLGTARSRNFGIAQARGRYIAELDADDVWLPEFLQRRATTLERRPDAGLAFAPVVRWYSWSGKPEDHARDWVARPWDGLGHTIQPPALVPILLENAPLGGVPKGWLMRREVIVDCDGYPQDFADMYEDQALLCKVGLSSAAIYLPDSDYLYRRHPASMVSVLNRTRDRREMRLHFLTWLERYLHESRAPHRPVLRSLRRELRRCRHPRMSRAWDTLASIPSRIFRKLGRISGVRARPLESA